VFDETGSTIPRSSEQLQIAALFKIPDGEYASKFSCHAGARKSLGHPEGKEMMDSY